MRTPDVSVVVISYNDSARLPAAIRSIQRQTLRALEIIVVDDASTDDTEELVCELALDDPRIRFERLAENSGGCSAPRNRGVELARAPWVMFCDSDDEYERHACKNLLQAAERLQVEVVCGTAERVDVRSGRTRRWRPEVHEDERVEVGLADFPELLFDTISVNKIYRRDLLVRNDIRFPDGLLFEDQLFTLEAMASAAGVAAIPEVVYRWHVDRLSDEPSITQRRNEARNVESRIEVNRRIDAYLAAHGLDRLQGVKDLKFLQHDLYLYLSSMLEVDDDTARTLMDRLIPYVAAVNLRPAWQLRPALRVAVYHLLLGDLEGVRAAMRFVRWASVVDVPIVREGGREMWACEHLDGGPSVAGIAAHEWLDVTELHVLTIPFTQRRYLHRLDALRIEGRDVVATGSTVDFDGSLAGVDALELRFALGPTRSAVTVPATWTARDGLRWQWEARGPAADRLGRRLESEDRGGVGLALSVGGHANLTTVRSSESALPRAAVGYPGRRRWTGPDAIELSAQESGGVGWQVVSTSPWRTRLARVRSTWLDLPGVPRMGIVVGLVRRDWLHPFIQRLGAALPARDVAVLETGGGRTSNGSVRAIADLLHRDEPGTRQAWVFRSTPEHVPEWAHPVGHMSLRHLWLLSRARYRIDDGTSPVGVRKPRGAIAALAGDGVPVHRIGLDDPGIVIGRGTAREVRRRSRDWDVVVAASDFEAEVVARAFAYPGRVACTGLPRMDEALTLLTAGRPAVEELRRLLDLPHDRPVVLYAPVARSSDRQGRDLVLDLDRWARALGDRVYLLVRPPRGERLTVPTRLRFAAREVADAVDVTRYLAASDLLVSDYESIIGDAALADIPVCLFQPDRDVYVNRTRGLYPGLDTVGPLARDNDELLAVLDEWLHDAQAWDSRHAPGRRAFAAERCGPADGHSAQRAADSIRAARAGGTS